MHLGKEFLIGSDPDEEVQTSQNLDRQPADRDERVDSPGQPVHMPIMVQGHYHLR